MTHSDPRSYRVNRADDLEVAIGLIRQHKLFLDDYDSSHTLLLLDEHDERSRMESPVKAVWFARDQDGECVACALVCEGGDLTDGSDTVSLFVQPSHRGQGLGEALLNKALAFSPKAWAFHTPEAQSLYTRKGLEMAFFSRSLMEHEGGHADFSDSERKPDRTRLRR